MPFKYVQTKKLGRGHCHKSKSERALSELQWRAVLDAAEDSQHEFNQHWKRDYTAIYLSFMLGLRIGEVSILERKHCRELLAGGETIHLPTLKQSERLPFRCKNGDCLRKVRVKAEYAGKPYECSKCGTKSIVPHPGKSLVMGVVEKDPGFLEEATIAYILDYIKDHMRPDQRWFFEGRRKGYHVSVSNLSRIFNTFAQRAGLSNKYSWHSLRHGRGVTLYSHTHEVEAVREGLRHKHLKTAEIYIGLDAELKGQYKKTLNKAAFDPLAAGRKKNKPEQK